MTFTESINETFFFTFLLVQTKHLFNNSIDTEIFVRQFTEAINILIEITIPRTFAIVSCVAFIKMSIRVKELGKDYRSITLIT